MTKGTQTKSKIFKGVFLPLSPADIITLSKNIELKMAYLDGLSYMHDLVIPFTYYETHKYFLTQETLINCGQIKSKFFNEKDSLSLHFEANFESSQYYSNNGYSILELNIFEETENLKRDTTNFINSILHTYNIVRLI